MTEQPQTTDGTRDGLGSGDHDERYVYTPPGASRTSVFNTREAARLLILRSRLQNDLPQEDQRAG